MGNLIRMDFYRLIRTKCMYVLSIIIAVFTVFSVSTIDEAAEFEKETQMNETWEIDVNEKPEDMIIIGVQSSPNVYADGTIDSYAGYLLSDLSSGIILVLTLIAAVLFVNAEQKSGFIKNIATSKKTKIGVYFSKVIVLFAYTVFNLILYSVTEYIALLIHYKGNLVFGTNILKENAHIFLLILLLHFAFISGVIVITKMTKSSTIGIVIGMMSILSVTSYIFVALEKMLDIELLKYTITKNLSSLDIAATDETIRLALVVGIVFIILYNLVGGIWSAARDVT